MTINLSDNSPRISYTVAAGVTQSSFTVPFDFFEEGDVNVYVDGVLKTITTDYTVSGGSGTGGTVTMSVTGISGGSSVVITRSIPLERTTDFPTSGPFDVTSLNEELDRITAINADLNDEVGRSLRLTDADAAANLTIPLSRANKVLAFDSNGNVDTTQEIGLFKGNWSASTAYVLRDIVKDTSTNNIFIANTAHTSSGSQPLTTNADSTKWDLIVDAASATTSATNAANSATAAATSVSDADKIATNAEDSQYTLSDLTTGYSALHYAAKAEDFKDVAVVQAGNALNSATAADNAMDATIAARDATFDALDNFDDRYLGSMSDSQTQATVSTTGTWSTSSEYPSQMTVADATGIVVGMLVTSASGINAETNVIAIDGTTIVVNQTFTTNATGQAVTFTGHGVLGNFDVAKDGPATDNDNNALVGGQLYYNETDAEIRLYNGSNWVAAYVTGGDFLALIGGTMTGNIHYGDNVKATFGDSGTPDLELYHNGSHSFLQDNGTGDFYIDGSRIRLRQASSANMFFVADTSGVKLYDGAGNIGFSTSSNQLDCAKRIRGVNAKEIHASVTSSSNTTTCDTTTATYFYTTLTENTTFAFSNPDNENTTTIVLEIKQDASASGFTVGWPAAVKWAGGTSPTLSAGANDVDLLTFITRDQGTTWYGFVSGLDMS